MNQISGLPIDPMAASCRSGCGCESWWRRRRRIAGSPDEECGLYLRQKMYTAMVQGRCVSMGRKNSTNMVGGRRGVGRSIQMENNGSVSLNWQLVGKYI
ncbi:hypothetical protein BRADI_3g48795v3 [Brachypodium distachyon]|uniref:Uncharacterized protein n=1 Tax=Brachypodium distachyon TaxID=15368 RepID=A0A2K2D459_BRADI|nr:hypothetical protein BRADI_3g48795v3 [Brachypodium distachyon]